MQVTASRGGADFSSISKRPGDLKPLHSSSIGKALLAAKPPKARGEVLAKLRLDAMIDSTIIDRARLAEEIELTASRGCSITRGENVADVMAVASTMKFGGDVYGIAVAGPMHRMTKEEARYRDGTFRVKLLSDKETR